MLFLSIGTVINEKDKCLVCRGRKVSVESKVLKVFVEKGAMDGEKIIFRGEGTWDKVSGKICIR